MSAYLLSSFHMITQNGLAPRTRPPDSYQHRTLPASTEALSMKLGLAASTSEMMSRRKLSTCPAHLCSIFLNFNSKNITCTSRMKEPAGHPRSRRNPATRPALPKVAEQNPTALQDWADVGLPAKEKNVAACVNMSLPMSPKEKHKLHVTNTTSASCPKKNPTQSAFATGHTVPDRRTFQCFERRAHKSAGLIGRCNRSARVGFQRCRASSGTRSPLHVDVVIATHKNARSLDGQFSQTRWRTSLNGT